ncbi:MAG TPA: cyclase family protein [Bdellovibrionota bacterium]|nr:cyclase family protein [Bdellovibrionota bacterium]
MRYFDISPEISPKTAVFPGDVPFSRDVCLDFAKGDHLLLSAIKASVHIGAHADAPNHYHREGVGIGERDLSYYFGECEVIRVRLPRGERILPEHLGGRKPRAERVLLHTGSFPDPNQWNSDYNALSPELVDYLAAQGVRLIGIDTPSIDPETSKALESHQAVFRRDLAILEGIVLEGVREGLYTLIALPLRLKDADASPVRAILVEKENA